MENTATLYLRCFATRLPAVARTESATDGFTNIVFSRLRIITRTSRLSRSGANETTQKTIEGRFENADRRLSPNLCNRQGRPLLIDCKEWSGKAEPSIRDGIAGPCTATADTVSATEPCHHRTLALQSGKISVAQWRELKRLFCEGNRRSTLCLSVG